MTRTTLQAELTQALEASRIDHEKMLARIKDQEAATAKAMQVLWNSNRLSPLVLNDLFVCVFCVYCVFL